MKDEDSEVQKVLAAEDIVLAAEDQALATEVQQVVAAEDQLLAAEDQALATEVQQVVAAEDQQILVAEYQLDMVEDDHEQVLAVQVLNQGENLGHQAAHDLVVAGP